MITFRRLLLRGLSALRNRNVAVLLLGILAVAAFSNLITGMKLYVIFDGSKVTVHQTSTADASVALSEAGIQISQNDYVSLPDTSTGAGVMEIRIERSHTVTLELYGETSTLSTLGETVGAVLSRAGVILGGSDEVVPDVSTPVSTGMTISVAAKQVVTESEASEIPFETLRTADDSLASGKEKTVQTGAVGERRDTFAITLKNGVPVSRELVFSEVVTPPQDEIIRYGTRTQTAPSISLKDNPNVEPYDAANAAAGGKLTLPSGQEYSYKKALMVTATAYTTEGHTGKRTASGTVARVGAIAVDPRVIPLGTTVYIEVPGGTWFYGLAVCEDTGGAIKGNIIDLFFNTRAECLQFGRRPAIVYILD